MGEVGESQQWVRLENPSRGRGWRIAATGEVGECQSTSAKSVLGKLI